MAWTDKINSEWLIKELEKSDKVTVTRRGKGLASVISRVNGIAYRLDPIDIRPGEEIASIERVCRQLGIPAIKTNLQKLQNLLDS